MGTLRGPEGAPGGDRPLLSLEKHGSQTPVPLSHRDPSLAPADEPLWCRTSGDLTDRKDTLLPAVLAVGPGSLAFPGRRAAVTRLQRPLDCWGGSEHWVP